MYLNGHIKVFINDIQVYSIISCETNNDSHNVGATCEIFFPLNSRIEFNGQKIETPVRKETNYLTAPTRYLFNTGDHIVIKAKYDGYESDANAGTDGYLPVFEGFLYDFYLTTPIKIKCLDYVYWFNMGLFGDTKLVVNQTGKNGKPIKNKIKAGTGVSYKKTTFKKVIQDLLGWVNSDIDNWNNENDTSYPHIELFEPMFDLDLVNISFVNMSPAAVLEWFKRELGLCITFLGNKLYINVASNTINTVKLKTDINVLKSELQTTNLKNHRKTTSVGADSVFIRLKMKVYFVRDNGTKDSFEIGDDAGQLRETFFYNVKPSSIKSVGGQSIPENYLNLATEALKKAYQARYSGTVESLLYPYYDILWKVVYEDVRYPERNGNYICIQMKEVINENGYHRIAKLAYLDDVTIF